MVNVEDKQEVRLYYGGFILIPSIAEDMFRSCPVTSAAHTLHFQGVLQQLYEKIVEVVVYDGNPPVISVLVYHYIGTECE